MIDLLTVTLAGPSGPVTAHYLIPTDEVLCPVDGSVTRRRVRLLTPCTLVLTPAGDGLIPSIQRPAHPLAFWEVRGGRALEVDLVAAIWRWALGHAAELYLMDARAMVRETMHLAAAEVAARLGEIAHEEVP